VLIRHTCCYT